MRPLETETPAVEARAPAGLGVLDRLARVYDAVEASGARLGGHQTLGSVLVVAFLGSLVVIEANRLGWLPQPLAAQLTTNHYGAVGVAFTLLLVVEVLALVFALAGSVAASVGKQFELLSLILLRKAFLEVGEFGEPIEWALAAEHVPIVLADITGALVIFLLVGVYYRVQRHVPITADAHDRAAFIRAKKVVALALLVAFLWLALADAWRFVTGAPMFPFFEAFFTVLIFSDVLLVLISLRYSSAFPIVFRNSGFAAATVVIRLALTAPHYVNVLLGIGAALFVVCLSLAYNYVTPAAPTAAEARDAAHG